MFAVRVAYCFNSGSTGADGALEPPLGTTEVNVQLPASGVLNYTTVKIQAGTTVRFLRNTSNTPAVLLASGDVIIDGVIDVSGTDGAAAGLAGDGNRIDDGVPGKGGPGGFDGGYGGTFTPRTDAGTGGGPGGGTGGQTGPIAVPVIGTFPPGPGGGGGFAGEGGTANIRTLFSTGTRFIAGGKPYGNPQLLPLTGGSGGGGGGADTSFPMNGSGGGGGGGAILIASSGQIVHNGSIRARGGRGGAVGRLESKSSNSMCGGGGSGGAIRLMATRLSGSGVLDGSGGTVPATTGISGGLAGCLQTNVGEPPVSAAGSAGYARLEADFLDFRGAGANFGTPGPITVPGAPGLRIAQVGGISVGNEPKGTDDVLLAANTPSPVTVQIISNGIPTGGIVKVTLRPRNGTPTSVESAPLSGTTAEASTTVQLEIPVGSNVISAATTFAVTGALKESASRFAQGETIERITLTTTLGGRQSVAIGHTTSGREIEIPLAALASAQFLQK
jgi:hypothetical protein